MTQIKVRARAVDMLGRQQIAGIPTAIHELFKNAHDAYATRVEVDYFRDTQILVIRDNGYGMTRHDVENRWLTLGTESRVNSNDTLIENDASSPIASAYLEKQDQWKRPTNIAHRIIMGEKGIGRLAIAVIAPITIVLTRATRPSGLHDLVLALVHWGIFEQPGVDLNSIDVPIKEIASGLLPTNTDIKELAGKIFSNLENLKDEISPLAFQSLIRDLNRVCKISPDKIIELLNKDSSGLPLSLSDTHHGTHFLMLPVAQELNDDIDGGADREASKLERNLLGFSNFMRPEAPVIETEFRDHDAYETRSLIGPNNFFTLEEFKTVDHSFEGEFDDFGQFKGTVSIFGKPREFVCNWPSGKGRQSRCGSFKIKFAHVHGNQRESLLSVEDWTSITKKLDRIGGIYIYRDGIRILPYGNSDVDWLDIEKRRTKSASDWFFSFRRVFGYVSITHALNGALSEKAGREGFRENQAYRDFRSILINFFEQLALEFFRSSSPQGDDYFSKKEELRAQAEILQKQKKKAEARRTDFRNELDRFFDRYEKNYFENEAFKCVSKLKDALYLLPFESDPGASVLSLKNIEVETWRTLRRLENENTVSQPKGLALGKALERDWHAYERMAKDIKEKILNPLRSDISSEIRAKINGKIENSFRVEGALQEIEEERNNTIKHLSTMRKAALMAADAMHNTIRATLTAEFSEVRQSMEEFVGEFTKRAANKPDELDRARQEFDIQFAELFRRETSVFDSFKRQIDELTEGITLRETLDDRFAALEAQNHRLEEQLDFYADYAQIGMAVGILQHEFEGAANGIRSSIGALKPWADRNPSIAKIYVPLRTHIEHLDGYLRAIDPLGRRLYRSTVMLSGEEILSSIRRVFGPKLEEENIELSVSERFRNFSIEGKSASLVGAFMNLIDNAIYWVSSRAIDKKNIGLDADEVGFLITNTGPGIEERIRDQIFDFGYSKKPGGRGMGLAVSRDALRRDGLDLELLNAGSAIKPIFRILKNEEHIK